MRVKGGYVAPLLQAEMRVPERSTPTSEWFIIWFAFFKNSVRFTIAYRLPTECYASILMESAYSFRTGQSRNPVYLV